MAWIAFAISSTLIVLAANQLAKHGDIIATRTKLGGMFIGTLLLAGATSLPEVLTTLDSIRFGIPNLAAGNLLGSNMFNMFLLAVLDLLHRNQRLLRKAAMKHALSGSLAVFIIAAVIFFIMAGLDARIGWMGIDSILIVLIYIIAVRLIQQQSGVSGSVEPDVLEGTPSLARGLLGFTAAAAVLIFVTPYMVKASGEIAELTGLGTSFIGTTLVALVTSLPELVTTIAAVRIGATDMAIGNLFGSNLFNMFAIGLADIFYTQGSFLAIIDPVFLLVGMLGLLMTGMALIGNLARLEKRFLFLELDALALIVVYFGGLVFLFNRGAI